MSIGVDQGESGLSGCAVTNARDGDNAGGWDAGRRTPDAVAEGIIVPGDRPVGPRPGQTAEARVTSSSTAFDESRDTVNHAR